MIGHDSEQRNRIGKVLAFIEQHLDQRLTLEQMAKTAQYSPSHFHRVFSEIVGESPADYVKRLKMENAAHLLIYQPTLPVTEIAFRCGFSSLSYFTAAFTEYFKHGPKAWREGAYLERFPRVYLDSKKSKQESTKGEEPNGRPGYTGFQWVDLSNVQTVAFPESDTVFVQRFGSYTSGIEENWERLYRWAKARDLIDGTASLLGVPRNNPYITPAERCRYDCCLTVPSGLPTGDGLEAGRFKGGKHVLYKFDEPVAYENRALLIECYSELYSYWLPRSGYRYLGNPVEFVEVTPRPGSLALECRITGIALAIEPK